MCPVVTIAVERDYGSVGKGYVCWGREPSTEVSRKLLAD